MNRKSASYHKRLVLNTWEPSQELGFFSQDYQANCTSLTHDFPRLSKEIIQTVTGASTKTRLRTRVRTVHELVAPTGKKDDKKKEQKQPLAGNALQGPQFGGAWSACASLP